MKKVGLALLFLLVGTLVLSVPYGILGSSNLVWGEDDQYGRVPIPSARLLHLPAREIDVSYAADVVGRGNETPDLPLPKLTLSVQRPGGPDDVKFDNSIDVSDNANEDGVNTQRRVWKIHVPKAGDYRVVAGGDPITGEANPQFWFGHGPPLPGTFVPILGFATTLAIGGFFLFNRRRAAQRP
jgi:hypothetical protein